MNLKKSRKYYRLYWSLKDVSNWKLGEEIPDKGILYESIYKAFSNLSTGNVLVVLTTKGNIVTQIKYFRWDSTESIRIALQTAKLVFDLFPDTTHSFFHEWEDSKDYLEKTTEWRRVNPKRYVYQKAVTDMFEIYKKDRKNLGNLAVLVVFMAIWSAYSCDPYISGLAISIFVNGGISKKDKKYSLHKIEEFLLDRVKSLKELES